MLTVGLWGWNTNSWSCFYLSHWFDMPCTSVAEKTYSNTKKNQFKFKVIQARKGKEDIRNPTDLSHFYYPCAS